MSFVVAGCYGRHAGVRWGTGGQARAGSWRAEGGGRHGAAEWAGRATAVVGVARARTVRRVHVAVKMYCAAVNAGWLR